MDDADSIENRHIRIQESKQQKEDIHIFAGHARPDTKTSVKAPFVDAWLEAGWTKTGDSNDTVDLEWTLPGTPVRPGKR